MKNSKFGPASGYKREHPPVENINVQFYKQATFGQRLADKVTGIIGSWPFMITQSIFLAAWMFVNVYLAITLISHHGNLKAWDPYPFILLNLILSFQAAYTGPIVMMSQNRQNYKDRLAAEQDYNVNTKAEKEIELIIKQLEHQDKLINELISKLDSKS